jgi:hypothetical protein
MKMRRTLKGLQFAGFCCLALILETSTLLGQQAASSATASSAEAKNIQEMQAVENRWSNAVNKRDQYSLELVLSPEFIGISSNGEVTTRNQQVSRLFVKDALPVFMEQKVINARIINDVAIVNGTYDLQWKLADGITEEKGVYSDVFEHSRGRWLCVNAQQTAIAQKPKQAAKQEEGSKDKTGKSDHSFHIPLWHKSKDSQSTPQGGELPN